MELTHDDVKKILEMVDAAEHLEEIEVVYGGFHLRVHRGGSSSNARAPARPPVASAGAEARPSVLPPPAVERTDPKLGQDEIAIRAPMLGTFYRAPTPGAPPFVEPGQRVKADDVIGLIEVMKLFNSIKAGVDGVVTRILAENGGLVEFDQALIAVSTRD
jgi:acetyl-CoA carboxylase biotin carboxyl carrier protein